jgi:hypothetical protein
MKGAERNAPGKLKPAAGLATEAALALGEGGARALHFAGKPRRPK